MHFKMKIKTDLFQRPSHTTYKKTNCWVMAFFVFLSSCAINKTENFDPYKKYAPTALKQDFDILQEILEADHPSLYWYTEKEKMDQVFSAARLKIKDSLSVLKYKILLSEVISNIQCGHTSVRNSKQLDKWLATAKPSLFPFGMRIFKDTLVATYNLYGKDTLISRGSVIRSINGFTSKQIIDSMYKATSTDGISNNFKNIRISGNFPFYFSLSFDTSKLYTIVSLDSTGSEKSLTTGIYRVPPKDTSKRKMVKPVSPLTKKTIRTIKRLNVRRLDYDSATKTPILTINSFSGSKQRRFFRKSLKKINHEKSANIILDVRNNGGGLISNSSALARYFIKKPTKIADSVFAKVKFSNYNRYIRYRFWYGLSMILFTRKKSDGNFHFGYFERHTDKPRKKNHFNGHIYVITGGFSFSATSLLVNALRPMDNVTVLGEETGGGAYGNSAVYIPDITLPNTKLRVRLPVFRLVMDKNREKNGHGFFPEIYVPPTLESLKYNRDNKMEKVLELIKSRPH
jgi:hypothetical protein